MSENRYNLRQEDDGTWTVFDIFTGLPAEVNEVEQVALHQAAKWAGALTGHLRLPPACRPHLEIGAEQLINRSWTRRATLLPMRRG